MDPLSLAADARTIAEAVTRGTVSARIVAEASLARIEAGDGAINAFTTVTAERALAEADAVDAARAAGTPLGPLAGVPYAVKNLFDLAGLTTVAGARITRSDPPATRDADLVERLQVAGAVCVGALNMGEFAYDFTGENAHYGHCRNPHDTSRMTGGSSSGSGAAVGAGFVPLTLGSDTNGSLRVPASLCGVFSLKPTYGRLSRGGSYPFVDSLDHLGPLARTAADLALSYDAMQGSSPRDHAQARRPTEPVADRLALGETRVGILGGWFEAQQSAEARDRAARVTAAFTDTRPVTIDGVEAGRAAAYLITNAESASWHLPRLRESADDFDPDTRDRFLAGALLPSAWLHKAQRVRRWWLAELMAVFDEVDLLVCPATPFPAPKIGQKTIELAGREVLLRPNLGLLAQPFSCVGLPVVTVPVFAPGEAPIGVQLIAPPWREDLALAAAHHLEEVGIAKAHLPPTS